MWPQCQLKFIHKNWPAQQTVKKSLNLKVASAGRSLSIVKTLKIDTSMFGLQSLPSPARPSATSTTGTTNTTTTKPATANPASSHQTSIDPIKITQIEKSNQSSHDLLFSLPPPIISLLAIASTPINLLSQLSLILQWSHPSGPWPSWILLLTWAFICLVLPKIFRFGASNLIFILFVILSSKKSQQLKNSNKKFSSSPSSILNTLHSFQVLSDHFNSISISLQPFFEIFEWSNRQTSINAIKTSITSLPFSILITYFIPFRFNSSNQFFHDVQLEIHSIRFFSFVPFTLRLVLNQLFPNSQEYQSNRQPFNLKSNHNNLTQEPQEIEFCFTIFENQRWWMGLDWSSTLLPNERPNWSDYLNRPVSAPNTFKLPSPTLTPDSRQKIQRRVEWKWLDPSWKILQAQLSLHPSEGSSFSAPRSEKSFAATNDGDANKSSPHLMGSTDPDFSRIDHLSGSSTGSLDLESEIIHESIGVLGPEMGVVKGHELTIPWDVDSNGWQYGDNHWEKLSKKASMGRFTRRRAWTRRALLITSLETLDPKIEHSAETSIDHLVNEKIDENPIQPTSTSRGHKNVKLVSSLVKRRKNKEM
ncbi:hypothetical protein O181_012846 [Austropuccinia psidii MF-1]|uniref:Peroxin/Ferlin domain-containing protein n=1 Tax=Austropuccinia psidii MF-1 TaxID=1389203 RepID=A0A9Q3BVB1_9BASI|nr:hypothetical protein [Austropuccinia psidii MF-1]